MNRTVVFDPLLPWPVIWALAAFAAVMLGMPSESLSTRVSALRPASQTLLRDRYLKRLKPAPAK